MKSIQFKASFGDKVKQVELLLLSGGMYHIYIDRFYYGQIINRNGKWEVLAQDPEYFTLDDMDALVHAIENSLGI